MTTNPCEVDNDSMQDLQGFQEMVMNFVRLLQGLKTTTSFMVGEVLRQGWLCLWFVSSPDCQWLFLPPLVFTFLRFHKHLQPRASTILILEKTVSDPGKYLHNMFRLEIHKLQAHRFFSADYTHQNLHSLQHSKNCWDVKVWLDQVNKQQT